MSRAERRSRTEKITKSRSKKAYTWFSDNKSWAKFYTGVKAGVHTQWVKHTGRICSCYICKKPRYGKRERRDSKQINTEE